MKFIKLNDGLTMPTVGFGTYKATENGYNTVLEALAVGYRMLDTAKLYENEEDVGRAIRESGIGREKIFLTSKLDKNRMGYDSTKSELEDSLKRLGTDYLDLYLIHWPRADYGTPDFYDWKRLCCESWQAMIELRNEGRIRSIGVSNFLPHHLNVILDNSDVLPSVNQLELHPGYMQTATCDFCRDYGIALEAWSPMGRGRLEENKILHSLAEKYSTTVPHLCLAYLYAENVIIIPKATDIARMKENLTPDDIRIEDEDIWRIRTMPPSGWGGEHPDLERMTQ